MTLEIKRFILGPIDNNTYLLWDSSSLDAVIVDPSFDIEEVIDFIETNHLILSRVWLTHAHFDHYLGIFPLRDKDTKLKIGLHPSDLFLWKQGGLGDVLNINLKTNFLPDIEFQEGSCFLIGAYSFLIIHTPGHSPGHVVFYSPELNCAFVGDLIFYENIGRTDLSGGSLPFLLDSIHHKIFALPETTILYPGHGLQTTVKHEISNNPYT